MAQGQRERLVRQFMEVPAAILAKMLGIHIKAAIRWRRLSNGDRTTFAAGISQRAGLK